MICIGKAGVVGQDMVGPGEAGRARPGTAWRGEARRGRHGKVRRRGAGLGVARRGRKGDSVKPEAVKAMREESGLSIAQAARCVQIAERSWQRYESGDREIPPGLVELFCLKNGLKYPPK